MGKKEEQRIEKKEEKKEQDAKEEKGETKNGATEKQNKGIVDKREGKE